MNHSDGKEVKVALQQTATVADVDQVKEVVQQVKRLSSNFISSHYGALRILPGNQSRETIHKWLSPPDPSTNHNIACGIHHKKTASWFFQGSIFQEWKSTGSLLWVHGKRSPRRFSPLTPSNTTLYCSWLGQEHSLVHGFFILTIKDD
jgi:hypothetical protein